MCKEADVCMIFLDGMRQKEEAKPKVIRTPYGYDCVKEGPNAVTCWESKGLPEQKE